MKKPYKTTEEEKNFIDYTNKVKKEKVRCIEEINMENDNISNHQILKRNILINSVSNSNNKCNPYNSLILDDTSTPESNSHKINFDKSNLYPNYQHSRVLSNSPNQKKKTETSKKTPVLPEDHSIPKKFDYDLFSINKSMNNNIIINNNDISCVRNDIKPSQKLQEKNINLPKSDDFLQMFSKQNILKSMTDQSSAKYLQKQLETISKESIDYIIDQLKGILREIMKDKNGNFFCKDLFKECDKKQRLEILKELYKTLSEDCIDNYSCHPIQTLIDRASDEIEYKYILYSFNDYSKLIFVSCNNNGAYTIQKIIERIPNRYRSDFNSIFCSIIGFLSRKKFGIVSVKKFISETKNDMFIKQIMIFIKENFLNLSADRYAHYLISFILEIWNNTFEGNEIKQLIIGNFDKMCQKKYSSFVCELFIKMVHPENRIKLINFINIDKIIKSNKDYSLKILKLLGVNINSNNNLKLYPNLSNNMNDQNNFMPNNWNLNIQNIMTHKFDFINALNSN